MARAHGLIDYGVSLISEMRTILKELVGDEASDVSQMPLMYDQHGNCFILDKKMGVLTRCGNLFDER